jgi:hypothetical protein
MAYKPDQINQAIAHACQTDKSVFVRYNPNNMHEVQQTLYALGQVEELLDVSTNAHTKLIELTRKEV